MVRIAAVDTPAQGGIGFQDESLSQRVARLNLAPGLMAFGLIASLGLMNGGYFATSWGWGSLAALWIAAVALVRMDRLRLGKHDLAFLGGMAGFLLLTAASSIWSTSAGAPLREVERGILVISALLAATLLARRRMRPLLAGVTGAITVASSYGLATRLFPTRLGSFDPVAGYRLAEPLGYWNALGIFAVIGTLLGLGFAARGRSALARSLGSAVPVLLMPTLYFTFGRGPWIALVVGVATAVALDRRRVQLVTTVLALSPFVGVALWLCAREPGLNRRAAGLGDAASEGRWLAFVLLALTAGAMAVGPAMLLVERRIEPSGAFRRAYAVMLATLGLVAIVVGLVAYGSPKSIAKRTYDAFTAAPVTVQPSESLNQRLFSLSNNGRLTQWRVAVDDYRAHPWLGSGAGTYELSWLKDRPQVTWKIRDAHSLYRRGAGGARTSQAWRVLLLRAFRFR